MSAADLDRIADGLAAALLAAGAAAATARDPWWVIGSAALALHGVYPGGVRDIDLLTSARDARAMLDRAQAAYRTDSGDDRFRSAVYGQWSVGGFDIDVMGDLDVAGADGWQPLRPHSREAITVGDVVLYVPSPREMLAILTRFGRAKDLRRCELLRAHIDRRKDHREL